VFPNYLGGTLKHTAKSNFRFVQMAFLSAAFLLALIGCDFKNTELPAAETEQADVTPVPVPVEAKYVCTEDTEILEQEMRTALNGSGSEYDFSYEIERADGRKFTHNFGASTPETVYESASTSKMVTGIVILRLVQLGILSLTDKPQKFIPEWPVSADSPLYDMTLEHLLSFRSGLKDEPRCVNQGSANFIECVVAVANLNLGNGEIPGEEFNYSGTHMQVEGLMAIRALGKQSWTEVFEEFKSETGLFPTGVYDLPSASNPRLAGGMHWTGAEYLLFLRALKAEKLLSKDMMAHYLRDQTAAPVTIGNSPARTGIGEDWQYGLGYWHECKSELFNCESGRRISSPGAYGAYPFWDREHDYIGMLSIQTALGGFRYGTATLERLVTEKANAWAKCEKQ
jgi:CubicO group peptidase (beta-lactamase class C family)